MKLKELKKEVKMKKTYKKIKVNKEWIENNTLLLERNRTIYPSGVNKFVNDIRSGVFDTDLEIQLIKDKDTGKFKILDGQHRLEAIRKENTSFILDMIIREDMADDESVEKCKRINSGKAWRLIDQINSYITKHDWLDAILDEKFPINVSKKGGVNSIRIDNVLNIICNGRLTSLGRRNLSSKRLPLFLEEFDSEVFAEAKEFFAFFKKCFGEPSKENWIYKNIVAFVIMRTWLKNKEIFDEETMVNCFKLIPKDLALKLESNYRGDAEIEFFTRKLYRAINKGRSVNKFKPFWEEE